MYDTPDYATEKLNNSWILGPENKLIFVGRVNDRWNVIGTNVKRQEVSIPFNDCNLETPNLGNINGIPMSSFVSRIPMRQGWRQGMRLNNLMIKNPNGKTRRVEDQTGFWASLEKTINNEFPTFHTSIEMCEDLFEAVAFTKSFSVNDKGELLYRGNLIVGECEVEPSLSNNHLWLTELFDKEMHDAT